MKNIIFAGQTSFLKRLIFISILLLQAIIANSQYFGRNKVNYQKLDFKVLQTPHFEIHHYLIDLENRNRIAQEAEQWYQIHQAVFEDTFKTPNPFILYNSHAHFQQTRTISGLIGVGTGGVTEALKNRVIMPFMESNAQTYHVLGHELVHAFQYHLVGSADSLSLRSLNNLPLWMVEGLAEYMSIGPSDPQTAMWLRSSVLNNKLPSLKSLTNRPDEFFPYRYGHAFWAFVTGIWGDKIIRPLFIQTGRHGYGEAIKRVLGIDEKTFSKRWQESLQQAYSPYTSTTSVSATGTELINKKNGGKLNVVPSVSPDGKLVAFWSEKSVFSLDLFVADAATGRIIKKLTSNSFNTHLDEYSSYESSVAWSPDSKEVAFVAFAKGQNRLIIVNTETGKISKQIDIPGVPAFSNPTWSPNGKTIVVTGLVDGQSDLYAYDITTKKVTQLTNDHFSDIQPSFSPDGKWVVFATDRLSLGNNISIPHYTHNIALLNIDDGNLTNMEMFAGANNLNPVFARDNNSIYFLSDRDGFRNLYAYDIDTKQLSQLTNLFTGISGITLYAPSISAARETDNIVYSYYSNNNYFIYTASASKDFKKVLVNANEVNMNAAMIPPFKRLGEDVVVPNMKTRFPMQPDTSFNNKPYRPKFELDYIGNNGVGISTSRFGTGLAGGVTGIFSDMLGYNQLYGALALNGEIYDFGGSFAYINQKRRINWGASISHIPYLTGAQEYSFDSINSNDNKPVPVVKSSTYLLRTFEDQGSLFAIYPFSQTRRIEAGASFASYYYRLDQFNDFYDTLGLYLGSNREKLDAPKGFNFGQVYLALVGDNANFGIASPLAGHRYRFEVSQYAGAVNLQSLLADYRKYFRVHPFTLATRNLFTGRFGKDAESGALPPLFLGFPTLIRGYQANNFANDNVQNTLSINDILGSKIFVSNAELRFPLTGPERLSAIRSRFLFTELAAFTDGGIAWGGKETPVNIKSTSQSAIRSPFILSSGISLRVNVFGYLVVEPFYAVPWQNGGFKNASFGLNLSPGW